MWTVKLVLALLLSAAILVSCVTRLLIYRMSKRLDAKKWRQP